MNKKEHTRKIFDIGRFLVIIIIIISMINLLGISRLDIGRMENFLMWFNGTVFVGLALFVAWLDYRKYEIIEGY